VAAELSGGKRVLELGCGSGQGFGLLGRRARLLVGGDYSSALLRRATGHYGLRFPLVRLSGNALPFADGSFDIILFFEASYYVPGMAASFQDITRVLAPSGQVLFVNANPERPDFISSPHSVHYHTAEEFRTALEHLGFCVDVQGAFPVSARSTRGRAQLVGTVVSVTRRFLERLRLVPTTLRGRARLKRLVYGKLPMVPAELPEGFAPVAERTPLSAGRQAGHKVLYVLGRRATA
jgi:SAM-dependent methyltransferase